MAYFQGLFLLVLGGVSTRFLHFVFISACGVRLAEMMENPVGDDDTDINLYQQLHQLEVDGSLPFAWFGGFQGGYVVGRVGVTV